MHVKYSFFTVSHIFLACNFWWRSKSIGLVIAGLAITKTTDMEICLCPSTISRLYFTFFFYALIATFTTNRHTACLHRGKKSFYINMRTYTMPPPPNGVPICPVPSLLHQTHPLQFINHIAQSREAAKTTHGPNTDTTLSPFQYGNGWKARIIKCIMNCYWHFELQTFSGRCYSCMLSSKEQTLTTTHVMASTAVSSTWNVACKPINIIIIIVFIYHTRTEQNT